MASRDDLFAVPPAEFTQARNALAKELRAAGKDEEARRVAALRKPTAALWVVNQLARTAPDQVKALIEAARRMRRAHGEGAGDDLREAMKEQREASQAIARAAEEAAKRTGAHANLDLLRRVQETAQAAAASDPDSLRAGSLEHELEPAGFDALAGTAVAAPRAHPKPGKAAKPDSKHLGEEQERMRRELREAERAAQELRKLADADEEEARSAQKLADRTRAKADESRRRAQEAGEAALALRQKL